MRKPHDANGLRVPEIVAYASVGTAAAFVLALTFGVFEQANKPRLMAASSDAPVTASTP